MSSVPTIEQVHIFPRRKTHASSERLLNLNSSFLKKKRNERTRKSASKQCQVRPRKCLNLTLQASQRSYTLRYNHPERPSASLEGQIRHVPAPSVAHKLLSGTKSRPREDPAFPGSGQPPHDAPPPPALSLQVTSADEDLDLGPRRAPSARP